MNSIKVLRGKPSPEELAAVIAVLQAQASHAAAHTVPARSPQSAWADPASAIAVRHLALHRLSALPHIAYSATGRGSPSQA
ncbi:hypothetical protein QFZ82_007783 [Streptomyces sp. V4I23]|uniref:acyl-CoA carboxylase subunit epsilon n=1 Tax=Streptomyces sp. V4I23 TaxID=3042282 RepID=UPI0027885A21|nr:acyl-CoA carboxylase subunit epsilon [Streptomyces sp. V4I23]MDQ1013298.1 hypothetical protein [Streptomyces sp. V4I23]